MASRPNFGMSTASASSDCPARVSSRRTSWPSASVIRQRQATRKPTCFGSTMPSRGGKSSMACNVMMDRHAAAACSAMEPLPGSVIPVHSSSDLQPVLAQYTHTLVVLMCKARSCRACKFFTKKFHRVAAHHPDYVFLELVCDESAEAFKLMEDLDVPAIPHFVMYAEGAEKSRLSSSSEERLLQAIQDVHC